MKITMLCEHFDEYAEYQDNHLARYYTKAGHRVVVITSVFSSAKNWSVGNYKSKVQPSTYVWNDLTIIRRKPTISILGRIHWYGNVLGLLDAASPDLIYCHSITANLPQAVQYSRRHPFCRLIVDYHGDFSNSGKTWFSREILHRIVLKRYLDRARGSLSRIFPVTPASAEFLRDIYEVPYNEMELLPLGVDTEQARAVKTSGARQRIRRKCGIPKNAFVIFTGGRLTSQKRTELLIEAFLSIDDPSMYLLIVGDSPAKAQAYNERLLSMAKRSTRIHTVGWLRGAEVYEYLDASDIAVFPASQSVLWQQSIGMGLPLIVGQSEHQDVSYLNKFGCIMVMPERSVSVPYLQQCIRRLAEDRALLRQMSAAAEKTTMELLDWKVLADRTLRFNSESQRFR